MSDQVPLLDKLAKLLLERVWSCTGEPDQLARADAVILRIGRSGSVIP